MQPGLIIGSYRLLRLLGEGGMGSVYLAEHTRLGRKVALKMLHPRFRHHPEAVQRFFSEARAVNQISHENLVEITDFIDSEQGFSCYIMELLEGIDLGELLLDSPNLPRARILDIARQVAGVLAAVHEAGIVHRDIKPDNIFLTARHGKTDFVKLLDFGVAKLADSDPSRQLSPTKTAAGSVLGTPTYMAPEQARGVAVDSRADIYALGVVLYELATGAPPFTGDTFGDLLIAHLTLEPPRPREIAGDSKIPKDLEDLILDCLEKEPGKRIQTMAEVQERLQAIENAPEQELGDSFIVEPVGGGRIIGIDLGTTNSCVAVLDGGHPMIIPNQEGQRTTPSMVSWQGDETVAIGASARRQMATNPRHSLFGVKRLMGRKLLSAVTRELTRNLPYTVTAASNGDARIEIGSQAYSPQEVCAHIVAKLVESAETYLNESIREAVITVPAYFDDAQRQATKQAGTIAGVKVRAILNEATAAALAYGLRTSQNQTIAVFDMGGGTFDVSIVTVDNGVFEVLSTSGDTGLGGEDVDQCLLNLLADDFERKRRIDLREDPSALQRLKEAAALAKVELSSSLTTEVNLPFIAMIGKKPLHLSRTVSREELERCCASVLQKLEGPCRRALEAANITSADVDHVLLVGGMTRMPAVAEQATKIFGKPATKGINPDEAVAAGAAIKAGMLEGGLEEISLLDVTPFPLGIRVKGDAMSVLIPANSKLPATAEKRFATTEDGQDFVLIEVYQGEDSLASKNRHLGSFRLGDLGGQQTRLRVAFTVDLDGILSVTATEPRSGRQMSVTIEGASGLSDTELGRLQPLRSSKPRLGKGSNL